MLIKRLGFADKYWSLLFTINGGLTGMVSLKCSELPYKTAMEDIPRVLSPLANSKPSLFLLVPRPQPTNSKEASVYEASFTSVDLSRHVTLSHPLQKARGETG